MTSASNVQYTVENDNIEYVNLVYDMRDNKTGLTYRGVIRLGKSISGEFPEQTRKSTVRKWITRIRIVQGNPVELLIKWNIPKNQDIVDFLFKEDLTSTNLSVNLGVPNYELNVAEMEITKYEIALCSTPRFKGVLNN